MEGSKWVGERIAEGAIITVGGIAVTELVKSLHSRDAEPATQQSANATETAHFYWFLPNSLLEPEMRDEIAMGLTYVTKDVIAGGLYTIGAKAGELAWKSVLHAKRDGETEPVEEDMSIEESKSAHGTTIKEIHHWYYPSEYLSEEMVETLENDGIFVIKGITDGFFQGLGGKVAGGMFDGVVSKAKSKQD